MEGVPNHALRVTANGGGCCGPSYEIMIDDKAGDGDVVVEKNGARLSWTKQPHRSWTAPNWASSATNGVRDSCSAFPNGAPAGGSCGCGGEETEARTRSWRRRLRFRRLRLQLDQQFRVCSAAAASNSF